MRPHRKFAAAAALAAAALAPTLAKADVIDGDWCFEGKHFNIQGPHIVTPEGMSLTGDYTRHRFSYVAPGPDPAAGETIFMILLNETTLALRVGAKPEATTQTWRRCDITS